MKKKIVLAILGIVIIASASGIGATYLYNKYQPKQLGWSALFAVQGGTGTTTAPTADQILIGGDTAGRYDVKILTAGTNMTISTSTGLVTLNATGGGGVFPWTPDTTYGENANSTSTPIWFKNTLYASSTSFFTGLATFQFASTTAISGGGQDLTLARIDGSTFSTLQDLQNIFHSAGWVSGGSITDDADGTITVASGTGLIRGINKATTTIFFTDWASEAGANVNLVNNSINYIYVEYNSGSPRVIATASERADFQTNILLALIDREGTTLHINTEDKFVVGDHAADMIRRVKDVSPFAHVTGSIISATGTRQVAITAGSFWQGLTTFSTASFDSATAGTWTYFFRDGSGGFTGQTGNSVIDNLAYDDNSGATTTLSNNKYGVHWLYQEVDDDISVLYGHGDYTLTQAQDAQPPASIPRQITTHGFLIGKIIIKESGASFTQIESAFETVFTGSLAADHGTLAGLADDDHTQYLLADGTRALSADWDAGSFTITSKRFVADDANATSTFAGGFAVNTSGLVYDISTGRVGIGTDSPLFELDVRGSDAVASFGTTNTFEIFPDFVGTGEINAGAFMQTGGGDMTFAADPTVGASTMIAYKEGGTWRSALEIAHTASGFGDLLLMKTGGNVGIGTTSPYAKLSVTSTTLPQFVVAYNNTNFGEFSIDSNGDLTISASGGDISFGDENISGTGTWDFGGATVKQHKYPSFTFPSADKTATTTTATTTIALGTAYVSEQWVGIECYSLSGTIPYEITDGTNKMNSLKATTTVSRFVLSTNNTFIPSETRFASIGPMTNDYISCTLDIIENF